MVANSCSVEDIVYEDLCWVGVVKGVCSVEDTVRYTVHMMGP